ncbi:MAG: ABC transporter substrate-binding protein [Rhodospirillales bacterium]|nr:ABC transporter substrate-binding protein [Rhodospirillales bacterium]
MIRRSFLVVVATAACLWAVPPASAQNPVPGATAFIDTLAKRAIEGLTSKDIDNADRAARFRTLFTETFDVPTIGRFALGTPWRTASEADRAEYLKAFEDFIVATYATRFADYGGEAIRTTGSRRGDDSEVFVTSEFVRAQGAPVRVAWRLRPTGDSWRIIDVIIEDVSMAITQRDDFSATIQRNGGRLSALIEALRSKTSTAGKS